MYSRIQKDTIEERRAFMSEVVHDQSLPACPVEVTLTLINNKMNQFTAYHFAIPFIYRLLFIPLY